MLNQSEKLVKNNINAINYIVTYCISNNIEKISNISFVRNTRLGKLIIYFNKNDYLGVKNILWLV